MADTGSQRQSFAIFVEHMQNLQIQCVNTQLTSRDRHVTRDLRSQLHSQLLVLHFNQINQVRTIELLGQFRDVQGLGVEGQHLSTAVVFRSCNETSLCQTVQTHLNNVGTQLQVDSVQLNSWIKRITVVHQAAVNQSLGRGQTNHVTNDMVELQRSGTDRFAFQVLVICSNGRSVEVIVVIDITTQEHWNHAGAFVLQDGVIQHSANHVAAIEGSQLAFGRTLEVFEHSHQTDRHSHANVVVRHGHSGEEGFAEFILTTSFQVVGHGQNFSVTVVTLVEVFHSHTLLERISQTFHTDHAVERTTVLAQARLHIHSRDLGLSKGSHVRHSNSCTDSGAQLRATVAFQTQVSTHGGQTLAQAIHRVRNHAETFLVERFVSIHITSHGFVGASFHGLGQNVLHAANGLFHSSRCTASRDRLLE